MKMLIYAIMAIILSFSAYSINCGNSDTFENGINCMMTTPPLNCPGNYTYSIFLQDDYSLVESGNLNLIDNSIYYFNLNLAEGDYAIVLCDGTYRYISILKNSGYDSLNWSVTRSATKASSCKNEDGNLVIKFSLILIGFIAAIAGMAISKIKIIAFIGGIILIVAGLLFTPCQALVGIMVSCIGIIFCIISIISGGRK